MDSNSDEQTELLRNILNETRALERNLGARIDLLRTELKAALVELRTGIVERRK